MTDREGAGRTGGAAGGLSTKAAAGGPAHGDGAGRRTGKADNNPVLAAGKLPMAVLEGLLRRYVPSPPPMGRRGFARGVAARRAESLRRVVVGPSVGVDAAAIDFGDGYLLAKTDPITFVAEDIGAYALDVNCNDIAVMGGVPRWFLATVLVPPGSGAADVERVFAGLSRACRRLGVALCGGHTEVTPAVTAPVVVGAMLGEVGKDGLVTSRGARPGDVLLLTKGIAIEAASILARTMGGELARRLSPRLVGRCRDLVKRPGISVLRDAQTALAHGRVHAMHDPTEGGLATALRELAAASAVGVEIEYEKIPVLREAGILLEHLGLDPMGSIASGALLIAAEPGQAEAIAKGLRSARIRVAAIGRVTRKRDGVMMRRGGRLGALPLFERDELARLFG
ncbi:MAG TPA: hypothetical protein ENJ37_01370 [Deltaproteobacteria bacterium]|nr:hypothetical protein [Deltaproteobacteria bacterium]